MENTKFDFANKEYLFFIKLTETVAHIGIIELDKISKTINEQEKFMYFRNIAELDYETLQNNSVFNEFLKNLKKENIIDISS